MKTVQAIGVGFGLAVGFAGACVAFVMCGAAAMKSSEAEPAVAEAPEISPATQGDRSTPAAPVAGWALFDGSNLAACLTRELADASEATLAADREKMNGWVSLPAGNKCSTLGGQIAGTCAGPKVHTTLYHYIGASSFGHVDRIRKGCLEAGYVFTAR
jgi:hypothetical protein